VRHDGAVGQGALPPSGFLDDWVNRLRGSTGRPVIGILLRGSHARDAATEYSDIDLDVLVSGPSYAAYPAYIADSGDRLTHLSVAVCDVRTWLARLDRPADWAFGLPVASPARLLWATTEWRSRLELTVIRQPAGRPELAELVADLGKVAGAAAAGDEIAARFAASDLARRLASVLRLANPPVTVAGRREALDVALTLPVTPAGYREDLLTCLGLRTVTADPGPAVAQVTATGPPPTATVSVVDQVSAAAYRLVAGTVALVRPYAEQLTAAVGPDLAGALRDGRLARYVDQLGRPVRPSEVPGSGPGRDGWTIPAPRAGQSVTVPVPDLPVATSPASSPAIPTAPHPLPARPESARALDPAIAARLRRSADGLVAAVVRQHDSGEVLMVAWMDDEALHRTLTTGRATYWSRSRQEYWVKGATSGNHQYVRSVALDCDGDALLVSVEQVGPACHTGRRSCFADDLPVSGLIDVPGEPR
jgi:phosphoribosyl-AMP cyclohydrolase